MSDGRWTAGFTDRSVLRAHRPDPDWTQECHLDPAVVRSLQKFQVGESGDGANLIARSSCTGDRDYAMAVRLFVVEEQNHARMLAELLGAAGAPISGAHWTDRIFMWSRRLMGLRLELMVLAIAEIVALRYYRALADGGGDPLLSDVSERILDDEHHHVPFQCRRLVIEFGSIPKHSRRLVLHAWRLLALGVIVTVAVDHGPALRACGVTRRAFVRDTLSLFDDAAATVFQAA
ncbi:ferritin-like domain-containing protein [Gordonia sp. ABSL11-1]|uniref:ferritin-like domain-containing protein n=1 Tax=Gordonia sp. ABSL11-1 TaxID=3053924 RepID=UPI0025730E49|nr:ferritin-like domain-containing protein [Gordonia sp. ABSL11-1]MDL9946241.1 ferritin-like domain-containing protein [Gordonia sp. ABSL11-1]